MGKQRGHRRQRNAVIGTAPPTMLAVTAVAASRDAAVRVPMRSPRTRVLVGEPVRFVGVVVDVRVGRHVIIKEHESINGSESKVFLPGKYVAPEQWLELIPGSVIECVARRQQGERSLYATELVSIMPLGTSLAKRGIQQDLPRASPPRWIEAELVGPESTFVGTVRRMHYPNFAPRVRRQAVVGQDHALRHR
jgi:hypothetical protein